MNSAIFTSFGRRFASGAMRFLAILMGVSVIATMAWAAVPKVGEKAPDFTIRALDDSQVKLASALEKGAGGAGGSCAAIRGISARSAPCR